MSTPDTRPAATVRNILERYERRFSKTETRFATKATCLAIYSRCVNSETPIEDVLRGDQPLF